MWAHVMVAATLQLGGGGGGGGVVVVGGEVREFEWGCSKQALAGATC